MQHVLQEALEEATAKLPTLFLQNLISKKLREQGIKPPKGLSEKIAEHFLAGNRGPFRYNGRKFPKDVSLTFSKADADEIAQAIDRFCETQLPKSDEIAQAIDRFCETQLPKIIPDV